MISAATTTAASVRAGRRVRRAAAVTISVALAALATSPQPARAEVVVDGAGSTWSQIAVDQWRVDVARQGLTINYQGVGSTAGRTAYYQGQVDFAVSEIPFQTGADSGGIDEVAAAASRPYAYLPIVAGGTAFMYQIVVAGKRVTDLRLSPETLGKIFTGVVTNWNDPSITADNNGRVLPSLPIKVVIRSDGSGTSAQFTAYMADQTPSIWSAFCSRAGLGANCAATSLYPNPPGAGFAAQQFSDGVANFVAAPYNNGAITYVEYGYAKERGFPVASIRNVSGAYVQPSAQAVAVALQGATIRGDGTQVLTGVYEFADQRAYPVSSYSYMIVPTTEAGPFSADEGAQLGNFILYFLCAGQQKAEQLGYSPLPRNLVQLGFDAVVKIPGAPTPPSITNCSNPTISGNFITAPAPAPTTPPPAPTPVVTVPTSSNSNSPGAASPTGGSSTTGSTGTVTAAGEPEVATDDGSSTGDGATTDELATGTGAGAALAQDSGAMAAEALGGAVGAATGEVPAAVATPIAVDSDGESVPIVVYVLIIAVALGGLFGLPATSLIVARRRESR